MTQRAYCESCGEYDELTYVSGVSNLTSAWLCLGCSQGDEARDPWLLALEISAD